MRSGSYDLHCHSTCSDGTKSPYELIDLAKKLDLKGIAITDHDTVAAYTDEVFAYARKQGIDLITGIECSSFYEKRDDTESVHILGLGIDPYHEKIIEFCRKHKERRKERLIKIVQNLKRAGFEIDDAFLYEEKEGTIGRPHIAQQLIEKGYVSDMGEAFKKFLGDRSPFFVDTELPSIEETIAAIKISGGRAILAHPVLIKGKKVLRKIISSYGFDGLECFYGNFSINRIEHLITICNERNWLITGGSDYHGQNRTFVNLGSSYTTCENMEKLKLERYGV